MKNISYTKPDGVSDLLKLLPYTKGSFGEYGKLNTCAICLTKLPKDGLHFVMVQDDLGAIALGCNACPKDGEWHEKASIFVLPENEDVRKSFIRGLRMIAIDIVARKIGYPVAVQHLKIDPIYSDGLIFTKDKIYSAFLQWRVNDPLIVGGWFAKDTLALTLSVIAGKTEISFISGFPIITSNDEELSRELAKGFKS